MRDAEMLVWAGDFNYRIEASYTDALHHIAQNELDWLLERVSICTTSLFGAYRCLCNVKLPSHRKTSRLCSACMVALRTLN